MGIKKYVPLRYQLLFFFIVIGLGTIAVISVYNFNRSKAGILERTFDQLTSVRVVKKRQIESFFNDRIQEAILVSESIKENYDDNDLFDQSIPVFQYIKNSGYYSKLIIIDSSGAITSFGLQKSEEVVNDTIEKGHILARIYANLRKETEPTITDFVENKGLQPSLFVCSPVYLLDSIYKSTVLMEIPLKIINGIMLEKSPTSGLGESGESYLVGSDFLMRSTSRFKSNSVLKTAVKTKGSIAANKMESNTDIITDYRGIKVLSSYSPLEIEGLNWIILAEIDFKEVMIPVAQIRNDILYISTLLAFIITGLSFFLSGRIIRPVIKLKDAALKVEQGKYDTTISSGSNDELGALISAFNSMTKQISSQTQELFEREERLSHFYEATNDGIFLHNSRNPILVNKALSDMTGFTENELMQMRLEQIIHCKSEKEKTNYETKAFKKDKSEFPVEIQQSTIEFRGEKIKACVIRDISRRKNIENELVNERKRRLSAVFNGQELERQRLSRELHDSLGQKLVALKLNFESIKNRSIADANENVQGIASRLNETIAEVRQISYNLMPPVLNEFGLAIGLKQLCNDIAISSNISVNFENTLKCEKLTAKEMIYLYRIAQEALNNSIKHASANEINLQLLQREKSLVLIIEDNGVGFESMPAVKEKGNGIYNMRERVNLLNGRFQIISEKNKGTLIIVRITPENINHGTN